MSLALVPERSFDQLVDILGVPAVKPEVRKPIARGPKVLELTDVYSIESQVRENSPIFGGTNIIHGGEPIGILPNGAIIYEPQSVKGTGANDHFITWLLAGEESPIAALTQGVFLGLGGGAMEYGGRAAQTVRNRLQKIDNPKTVSLLRGHHLTEAFPGFVQGVNLLLASSLLLNTIGIGVVVPNSSDRGKKPPGSADNHSSGPSPENGGGWWGLSLAAISLFLAACAQRLGLTETPPKVSIATNTPDTGLTSTPKPAATETPRPTHTSTPPPTETPFYYGSGGSILPDGSPVQAQALLDLGMQLPPEDCITAPNDGGNQAEWDERINRLAQQGASAFAINDLQIRINSKLELQGLNASTSLELCVGEGWGFAVRDNSSKLLWWPFDLEENKFADRPDRWQEGNWEFRKMPTQGLKEGLKIEISLINGWPLAVAVDKDGKPIQYFDQILREFKDFEQRITPTPDTRVVVPDYYGMGQAEIRQVYQSEDITTEFLANPSDLQPIFFFHQNPLNRKYGREELISVQYLELLSYRIDKVVLNDQTDQPPLYNAYLTVGYIDQTGGKHTFTFETRSRFGTNQGLEIINPDSFPDRYQVGDEISVNFGYSSGGISHDKIVASIIAESPSPDEAAESFNVNGSYGDIPISFEEAKSFFRVENTTVPANKLKVVTITISKP